MDILSEGHAQFLELSDVDKNRSYIRDHRPRALVNKVMSDQEAISKFVSDGDYLNVDNNLFQRGPGSLLKEIIRQRKKDLGFCGKFTYADVSLLTAGGCLNRLDIGYIGTGLAPVTSAINKGKLKVAEWCNSALTMRLMAGSMGIPFVPVRFLGGTSSYQYSGAKTVKDPFTNKEVVLLPALNPDVALIHVNQCDVYGNSRVFGCSPSPIETAGASKKVIISTEEIIDTEDIRRNPSRTTIPCYLVDAVVKAPFGSYPGEVPGLYAADFDQITKLYQTMNNKDEKVWADYLEKNVYSVKSHEEFLEKRVGLSLLMKLKTDMQIKEGYYD
jgi:glutaconate CoA-transferase, subunit A